MTLPKRILPILSVVALGCPSDEDSASGSASMTAGSTADESGTDASASASASATQGSVSAEGGSTDSSGGGSVDDSSGGSASMTASASATGDSSGGGTDAGSTGAGTDAGTDAGSTGGEDGSTSGVVTDSDTNTTGIDPNCEAPGDVVPCDAQTNDPFQAIGLNCPGNDPNQVIPIDNESFTSADVDAWKIARQLGTHIDPMTNEPLFSAREGEQFLVISTGRINNPNGMGVITMVDADVYDSNGNPDLVQMPAPMLPQDGSNNGAGGTPFVNCDDVGDCSDTLEGQWAFGGGSARDLLWFQFEVDVPGGTNGFSFDFAYFSVEFPEYVNTTFNDIFTVWSNSETYTGNLCFINDQPCTVTALCDSDASCPNLAYCNDAFGCANPPSAELDGTGFQTGGGGTGWYNAKASAQPGEPLQLTWAIFDMGDSIYDTLVILDNWKWDCEGCVPNEVMGCGIDPQ